MFYINQQGAAIIPAMNQLLNDATKQTAESLIDMSAQLADKMDAWHNIVVGEGSLRNTERAGFVNKTSADSGIDLVVDIQAPAENKVAVLRTWAVESKLGDNSIKLFSNIQLTFSVQFVKARSLTERFATVTRDDIRNLLHEPDTVIKAVVISDQSGLDKAVQKTYGKRYDVSADEIVEQGITKEICSSLNTVLKTLQNDAVKESTQ